MYDDYEFDGQESGASTIVGVFILCALILGGAGGLIWYLQGPFVGRQFVVALLSPLGIVWTAAFFGAMVATFTKQKFLAFLLWVLMLGLSMLGNQSIANSLIAGLEESQEDNAVIADDVVYDYGFVLGGGLSLNRLDRMDFNAAGERVSEAVRFYKQGKIQHLVFTGSPFLYEQDEMKSAVGTEPEPAEGSDLDTIPFQLDDDDETGDGETEAESAVDGSESGESTAGGPFAQIDGLDPAKVDQDSPVADEAVNRSPYENALRSQLEQMGVAATDYTFIGGRNTTEEMLRIDEFLKDHPADDVAMITSAWHMPRAARLRMAQGLDMKSVPVDFRTTSINEDPIFFIPKLDPFYTSSIAIKEYLAGWFQ